VEITVENPPPPHIRQNYYTGTSYRKFRTGLLRVRVHEVLSRARCHHLVERQALAEEFFTGSFRLERAARVHDGPRRSAPQSNPHRIMQGLPPPRQDSSISSPPKSSGAPGIDVRNISHVVNSTIP